VKPTKFLRVVTVDDLESGETVVLRKKPPPPK
jgi:hypothetical protein